MPFKNLAFPNVWYRGNNCFSVLDSTWRVRGKNNHCISKYTICNQCRLIYNQHVSKVLRCSLLLNKYLLYWIMSKTLEIICWSFFFLVLLLLLLFALSRPWSMLFQMLSYMGTSRQVQTWNLSEKLTRVFQCELPFAIAEYLLVTVRIPTRSNTTRSKDFQMKQHGFIIALSSNTSFNMYINYCWIIMKFLKRSLMFTLILNEFIMISVITMNTN